MVSYRHRRRRRCRPCPRPRRRRRRCRHMDSRRLLRRQTHRLRLCQTGAACCALAKELRHYMALT